MAKAVRCLDSSPLARLSELDEAARRIVSRGHKIPSSFDKARDATKVVKMSAEDLRIFAAVFFNGASPPMPL